MVLTLEQRKQLIWIRKEIDALKASNEIQKITRSDLEQKTKLLKEDMHDLNERIKKLEGNCIYIEDFSDNSDSS